MRNRASGLLRDKGMAAAETNGGSNIRRDRKASARFFRRWFYILSCPCESAIPHDHRGVAAAHKHLQEFFIRDGDEIPHPSHASPRVGYRLALHALAEAGSTPETEPAKRGDA